MFDSECSASPSYSTQPRRAARILATVVLPLPDTPITTRTSGFPSVEAGLFIQIGIISSESSADRLRPEWPFMPARASSSIYPSALSWLFSGPLRGRAGPQTPRTVRDEFLHNALGDPPRRESWSDLGSRRLYPKTAPTPVPVGIKPTAVVK